MSAPDIVVVGGGPIGLWTAVQTKSLQPAKEIVVVEKHLKYQRSDIRLNLKADSFRGMANYKPLRGLVKKWQNQAVPIQEMEAALTRCAHALGVHILTGITIDPKKLLTQFPKTKLFIGADGAHSALRKELFGDQYWFNTPMQYMAQVQYRIKAPLLEGPNQSTQVQAAVKSYKKQKFAGHLITQRISPLGGGQCQVTVRIFIDEKMYQEMEDAKFSTPYYFEKDLEKVPASLRDVLIKWWGANPEQEIIKDIGQINKMTVIPLTSYSANEYVKEIKREGSCAIVALVGDAAQGYPFFRAINKGLLTATTLAQTIDKAFQKHDTPQLSSFRSYSCYATWRAVIERTRAFFKNLFINLAKLWIKISSYSPWQMVKFNQNQQKFFQNHGMQMWEKLSRVDLF